MTAYRYFEFLWLNIAKKKATWIVGLTYILFICVFILFIPAALKRSPFMMWTDAQIGANVIVLYTGALFSAIQAIIIFRDFNENGTELMIFSKPVARWKLTGIKFFVYVLMGLIFSAISSLVGFFVLCFPGVSFDEGSSLVLSIMAGNLAILLTFGALAILITIHFNKIWTILINICTVIAFMLYFIVASFVVKTPALIAQEDALYNVQSNWYAGQDNKIHYGGAITSYKPDYYLNDKGEEVLTPLSKILPAITTIQKLDDAKKQYKLWDDKSVSEITNNINVISQFNLLFNSFELEKRLQKNAIKSIGSNAWYKYEITNNVNDFYDSKVTPIAAPGYTPMLYVSGINNFTTDYNPVPPFPVPPFPDPDPDYPKKIQAIVTSVLNENVIVLGVKNEFEITSLYTKSDKTYVAKAFSGLSKQQNANFLEISDLDWDLKQLSPVEEKSWDLQKEWMKTQMDDLLTNPDAFPSALDPNLPFSQTLLNNKAPLFKDYDDSFYNYIHDKLVEATIGTTKNVFNIKSTYDLNLASLKFKYFLFKEMSKILWAGEAAVSSTDQPFRGFNKLLRDDKNWSLIEAAIEWLRVAHPDEANYIRYDVHGSPLYPTYLDKDEEKNPYFWVDRYKRMRAILDEYVVTTETYGYKSITPRQWERIKDANVGYLYFTKIPLYLTYQNLFFNYDAKLNLDINVLWSGWFAFAAGLFIVAIIIYYRVDFK